MLIDVPINVPLVMLGWIMLNLKQDLHKIFSRTCTRSCKDI